MLSIWRSPARQQQVGQGGMTLIEVIVAMAILAVIAGAIAGAFTVGFHALAPGGSKDRLQSAHDLSFLEQVLGKDGARAACVTAPDMSSGTYQVYGKTSTSSYTTCSSTTGYGGYGNVAALAACTGAPYATLCLGWPELGTAAANFADSKCHIAVYTSYAPQPPATPAPAGNVMITRTEYVVPMPGSGVPTSSASVTVDHFDTVLSPWVQGASPSGFTPPNESYTWLRSLQVKIVGTGVNTKPPQQTMVLHPIAVDPSGPESAITPAGSPC